MHWPFLAPTVRVSFGGKTAQIGALNCFNAILQACTPPHCFSASSHVVQSRPALAAYHAPDLLGGGSCTSHNPPCQVEPTEVGKLSRESSPESRPRLLSTLLHDAKGKSAGARQRASNKRDKGQRAKKKCHDYQTIERRIPIYFPKHAPRLCCFTRRGAAPGSRHLLYCISTYIGLVIRSFRSQGHGDLKFNGDLVSCGLAREPFCAFDPISEERAALAGPIWTLFEEPRQLSIQFDSIQFNAGANDGE